MNHAFRQFVLFLALSASLCARAAITASLDRDHIAVGETVRLLLQRDGSTDEEPDISPLRRDFDVLGSSKGSSVQIINGHASSQVQISLVLAPKHDGAIRLPSLQWGGETTPVLELLVGGKSSAQQSAPADGSSHVFLSATLDHNQTYVQTAVVLTVKLFTDQPLVEAALDLPANGDVLIKQFGEDKQTSESRNGNVYQVVERKYLLIPQRSGPIQLAGPVLDAKLMTKQNDDPFGSDPFFSNAFGRLHLPRLPGLLTATRPIHLRAKPIELNVQPRPASAKGSRWLPAQNLTLEETWRPEKSSIHAGEPITRHLRLTALGLTGAQLPDLSAVMRAPDGIKLYPDQSRTEDHQQGATVLGSRDQDIAFVAQQPGHYVLPEVRLSWWDTVHDTSREATLPSRQVDVLPAAGGTFSTMAPEPAKASPSIQSQTGQQPDMPAGKTSPLDEWPWPFISLALALLWLGTLFTKWRSTRGAAKLPTEDAADAVVSTRAPDGSAFKAFQHACRNNEPQAARRHLLEWASDAWPTHRPLGLSAVSQLIGDARLADQLRTLDRACHMNAAWNGESLAESLPAPPIQKAAVRRKADLPDLYPEPD